MAKYLLALKDRREVAKDTMAFWFDTLGAPATPSEQGNTLISSWSILRKPMARAMGERCLLQLPLMIRVPLW